VCNGQSACSSCIHAHSASYGDTSGDADQRALATAFDGAGNLLVAGEYQGNLGIGGQILSAPDKKNLFVAKFDTAGAPVWAFGFGSSSQEQNATAVAGDAQGNVYLAGRFMGDLNFGTGTLSAGSSTSDVFIAKFDPSGVAQWSYRFGTSSDEQAATAIGVDSVGNVWITGEIRGSVNFGGGTLSAGSNRDVFIAKFGPNGNHLFSRNYGDSDEHHYAYGLTVDAANNVLVTGGYRDSINFGTSSGTSLSASSSVSYVFVVKLDSNGGHLWSDGYGDGDQSALGRAITTDALGNVTVTGEFRSSLDFGGADLDSSGSRHIFLVQFDSAGNHLWSDSYGGSNDSLGLGIDTDPFGNVLLAGHFKGSLDFGGGALQGSGVTRDVFLAKFASDGTHLCSRSFGNQGENRANGIAADALGNVAIVGEFRGSIDFGGTLLSGATGKIDVFVAGFEP
jgi:hypothetical protein